MDERSEIKFNYRGRCHFERFRFWHFRFQSENLVTPDRGRGSQKAPTLGGRGIRVQARLAQTLQKIEP